MPRARRGLAGYARKPLRKEARWNWREERLIEVEEGKKKKINALFGYKCFGKNFHFQTVFMTILVR